MYVRFGSSSHFEKTYQRRIGQASSESSHLQSRRPLRRRRQRLFLFGEAKQHRVVVCADQSDQVTAILANRITKTCHSFTRIVGRLAPSLACGGRLGWGSVQAGV